jgi:hypothetical protein
MYSLAPSFNPTDGRKRLKIVSTEPTSLIAIAFRNAEFIFEDEKNIFLQLKMVGILRKALQLLKMVRGPALKILVPVLDSVLPGLGQAANFLGTEVVDRAERVHDEYDKAKEGGQKYSFMDGVKTMLAPSKVKSEPKIGAMLEKTKDYGGLHPRLHLKDDDV